MTSDGDRPDAPWRGRPGATLAAVAARVGVSRTTVSNAYNRPDQLSAELRDRILAAAAELGYSGRIRWPDRCGPGRPTRSG